MSITLQELLTNSEYLPVIIITSKILACTLEKTKCVYAINHFFGSSKKSHQFVLCLASAEKLYFRVLLKLIRMLATVREYVNSLG